MTDREDLPETGYRLNELYTIHQSYSTVQESEFEPVDKDRRPISVRWDWRYLPGTMTDEEPVIEVMLSFEVDPVEGSRDTARVDQVGRFTVINMDRPVEVREFVLTAGPATLVPYIRQKLTALTDEGPWDVYHLPTLNVRALMQEMEFEETTGWEQMQEAKELETPAGNGSQ